MIRLLVAACVIGITVQPVAAQEKPVRIATFQIDITPPLGTPLCDALCEPAKEIVDPLSARGIVLLPGHPSHDLWDGSPEPSNRLDGSGEPSHGNDQPANNKAFVLQDRPIVLCALDWVGIGNSGYDAFRQALAKAAGTSVDHVCIHCLHQHDAPGCDFEADAILSAHGLGGKLFDPVYSRAAITRLANAVHKAIAHPVNVTHIGIGKAKVIDVASNRRVLGPDGKVKYIRYSATADANIRAQPEGVVDPYLQLLSFWNGDRLLVSMTYYATHPQSYYGKGGVSYDFPGLARRIREHDVPGALHIHFNGAGGNVAAGKYNDGAPANRAVLAGRLAKGMKDAFDAMAKTPITGRDVSWRVAQAPLPCSERYHSTELATVVSDTKLPLAQRLAAARDLAWAKRCERGAKIDIACLHIGPAYVLHMPGELFVEYQLAAQKMRPDSSVMMAAYGDYGPGYIGTAIAYTQGGYETGPPSRVSPKVEEVLLKAMRAVLK